MSSIWTFEAELDILKSIDSSVDLSRLRKIFGGKYVWLALDFGNVTATVNGIEYNELNFGDHEECSISFVLSDGVTHNIIIGDTFIISARNIPVAHALVKSAPLLVCTTQDPT